METFPSNRRDRPEDGRQPWILVVIAEFTRERPAIELARSFAARHVIMTLRYPFAVRGAAEHLRSDDRPEIVAMEIQERLSKPRACMVLWVAGRRRISRGR